MHSTSSSSAPSSTGTRKLLLFTAFFIHVHSSGASSLQDGRVPEQRRSLLLVHGCTVPCYQLCVRNGCVRCLLRFCLSDDFSILCSGVFAIAVFPNPAVALSVFPLFF